MAEPLALQFGPGCIKGSQLAFQGFDLALVAEVEILGADPKGAVAGNDLLVPQGFKGLELLINGLVGGLNRSDLGPRCLLLAGDGPGLPPQGIRIGGDKAFARGCLVNAIEGEEHLTLANLLAHLGQHRLHLAG